MKILLPTDGSSSSETAARFLKRLNLSDSDEITILHVISDDPFQDREDYYNIKIKAISQLIAPKILNSAMNILQSIPSKINKVLMHGYPDKCIVDKAVNLNADMIVMGPKRLKGIKSRIVGSVTKSVSIISPKPILVIKPAQGEPSNKIRILFATDGSDHARRAAEILTLMPFHDNTEITVIHVVAPAFYDVPDEFMAKIGKHFREDLNKHGNTALLESENIIAQTMQYLSTKFSALDSLTKIGDPTDEILQAANELKADLIVVGSKGMGGLRGAVGSLSRYILSMAECSVLIGKTDRL
ncbi:MAG: universal stress protein [Dissulfurispiraceae bacterium]